MATTPRLVVVSKLDNEEKIVFHPGAIAMIQGVEEYFTVSLVNGRQVTFEGGGVGLERFINVWQASLEGRDVDDGAGARRDRPR
jgi:hypothetical protein